VVCYCLKPLIVDPLAITGTHGDGYAAAGRVGGHVAHRQIDGRTHWKVIVKNNPGLF